MITRRDFRGDLLPSSWASLTTVWLLVYRTPIADKIVSTFSQVFFISHQILLFITIKHVTEMVEICFYLIDSIEFEH